MFEKYDILITFQEKGIEEVNERVSNALQSINANIATASNKFMSLTDTVVLLNAELNNLAKRREITINTQSVSKAISQITYLENRLARLSSVNISTAAQNNNATESTSQTEAPEKEKQFADLTHGKKIVKDSKSISKLLGTGMKANIAGYLITETLNQGFQLYGESVDALRANEKLESKLAGILHSLTKAKQINEQISILTTNNPIGENAAKHAITLLNSGTNDTKIIQQLGEIGIIGAGDKENMSLLTTARADANKNHFLSAGGYQKLIAGGLDAPGIMRENWRQLGFKTAPGNDQINALASGGQLPSDMLDKIFELASASGSYYEARATQAATTTDSWFTLYNNNKANLKKILALQQSHLLTCC